MTIHRRHRRSGPLSPEAIGARIRIVRGQRVLLDEDLGTLYGVPTGAINQSVARNPDRFPSDFAFPLTRQELLNLKSQNVISSWGGRRAAVVAFTEQRSMSMPRNSERLARIASRCGPTFGASAISETSALVMVPP